MQGASGAGHSREQGKVVTILFADVVGSTSLAAQSDPEVVRSMMDMQGRRVSRGRPAVHLPRGVPHTFVVEGDSNARYLVLYLPGGAEGYFVEAGRPAEGDGLPPRGPWDIELMARVSAKFQMEIVGPPMKPRSESR